MRAGPGEKLGGGWFVECSGERHKVSELQPQHIHTYIRRQAAQGLSAGRGTRNQPVGTTPAVRKFGAVSSFLCNYPVH